MFDIIGFAFLSLSLFRSFSILNKKNNNCWQSKAFLCLLLPLAKKKERRKSSR